MTIKEIEIQLALGTLPTRALLDLASDSNTPKKILTTLSTNEVWLVRHLVFTNQSAPKKIREKLSESLEERRYRSLMRKGF